MPKVSWVMSYEFCNKLHALSSSAKNFSLLKFDKVTDTLMVGTFSEAQCSSFTAIVAFYLL